MNTEQELLLPREVDRLLSYPRGRAARLARAGKLPAIFLPDGEIRFDRDALAEALVKMTNQQMEGTGHD